MGRFTQGMSGPAAIDALNAMDDEFTGGGGGGSGTSDNDSITNQQAIKALTGTPGLTTGDILYASGTNIMSRLAAVAAGNVLISNGVGVAPSYGKVNLNNALHVSGILPATNGGTGKTSYAQYSLLFAATTQTIGEVVAGAAKTVLTGTGVAPTFAVLDMTFMPTSWVKQRVICASTAALTVTATSQTLTNSGTLAALVMDSIAPAVGEYVLIKDQAAPAQNGIYELTTMGSASVAWVLTRPDFADTAAKIAASMVGVTSGTTNGGETFTTKFKSTNTIGTTSMTWTAIGTGGGGSTFTTLSASGNVALASDGSATTFVDIGNVTTQNGVRIYGRGSGSAPRIVAYGYDSSIPLQISSKLTSSIEFFTRDFAARQFEIGDTFSTDNWFMVTGGDSSGSTIYPILSAKGSSTDIDARVVGKGTGGLSTTHLKLDEGTNKRSGLTAAMTAGTITVNTTAVTANSRIHLTAQNTGGTPGALRVSARTAGTSFTITSTSASDTSTVAWMIVEPA